METNRLGSVLRRLLVSLRLLCSVQGILLVELQHLHLLLDGIHGCLLSWRLTERRKQRGGEERLHQTELWPGVQAQGLRQLTNMCFALTSSEGHLIPSLSAAPTGWCRASLLFFKELICNSLCKDIWPSIWLNLGLTAQDIPSPQDVLLLLSIHKHTHVCLSILVKTFHWYNY